MKNCERFTELLADYADNTLAPSAKRELDDHLQECSECHSAADGVINLRHNLRRLSPLQTSPDFETILRTRIKLDRRAHAEPIWGMPLTMPRRFATYSATAVLAVLGVFYLWQRLSANALSPSPAGITVSQMQIAPNQILSEVSPAKILYTLDQVTPQLWPNFGVTRKGTERLVSTATDSVRTAEAPPATVISPRPVTF